MKLADLEKPVKQEVLRSLKSYFLQERDEEISDFQAENLLDAMVNVLGPVLYNQGIRDAQRFMAERTEDLAGLEKREA